MKHEFLAQLQAQLRFPFEGLWEGDYDPGRDAIWDGVRWVPYVDTLSPKERSLHLWRTIRANSFGVLERIDYVGASQSYVSANGMQAYHSVFGAGGAGGNTTGTARGNGGAGAPYIPRPRRV